jgi:hypothetical protein
MIRRVVSGNQSITNEQKEQVTDGKKLWLILYDQYNHSHRMN